MFLDRSDQVTRWASEEIGIKYLSPKDNKIHTYYPDAYYETVDGQKWLAEIKPKEQTFPPGQPKKRSKSYNDRLITYYVNMAKWEAAKEFCEKNGINFVILTEDELKSLGLLKK